MNVQWLIPFTVVAAVACSDAGADAGSEAVVRDSVGITIVENPLPPDSGGALALAPEPEVTIGVLEGAAEYQLYRVGRPALLSDGRIAVPNGGTEIRYYSPDGRYLQTVGGDGDGPGEFRNAFIAGRLPGDTLLVYDRQNRRLNVIDDTGAFVRSVSLTGDVRFPFPAGMTDPHHMVFTSNRGFESMGEAPAGLLEDTVEVFIVSWREGLELNEPSFTLPGNRVFVSRGENFMAVRGLLLAGNSLVAASGGPLHWSSAGRYEIHVLGPDGTPTRIVRRAHEPVPLTSAHWDAEVERMLENTEDENWRRRQRQSFGDMPRPSHLPARGVVAIDQAGRIWVERYRSPTEDVDDTTSSSWDVFDESGRWMAVVSLPSGFRPMEIGADYVLGVHRDEFDVEQVRLYRLETRPAGE